MQKRILVLGATGMLGYAVFRWFHAEKKNLPNEPLIFGSIRHPSGLRLFPKALQGFIKTNIEVLSEDSLIALFSEIQPTIVINCVGVIKQLEDSKNPLVALPINALLPHRLAALCALSRARLIHIGTDCVFSGNQGNYTELDHSDVNDVYGLSKYLGEVSADSHVVTLRTSIIGHELSSSVSLVDWFLQSHTAVKGYRQALYSGIPAVHFAKLVAEYVIPDETLSGLWHVSADPIDKCALLQCIAEIYGKKIEIIPNDEVKIDRTLDSSKFRKRTGYQPPSWPMLIQSMKTAYDDWQLGVR